MYYILKKNGVAAELDAKIGMDFINFNRTSKNFNSTLRYSRFSGSSILSVNSGEFKEEEHMSEVEEEVYEEGSTGN